jgi:hypothetical protein
MAPFEVFYVDGRDTASCIYEVGWYWWYCWPGCLPDSEAYGPYFTEQAAYEAAREDREI